MPFESTLIIAFADVIDAGLRIARSITGTWNPVEEWSALLHDANTQKDASTQRADKDVVELLHLPNAAISVLLISSQPLPHQATLLAQAIVQHAKQSKCRHVIVFGAANMAGVGKDQPFVAHLHQDANPVADNIALLPSNASLGDHVLGSFATLLSFSEIPSTILVHPAKKGGGWKYDEAITLHLAQALTTVVGNKLQFSNNIVARASLYGNDADSLLYI